MIYKLYTRYVTDTDAVHQTEAGHHTNPKGKTKKDKTPTQWSAFEDGLQAYLDKLALHYVTVTVTGSPSLVAVQGGAPGTYLVCQAIMCAKKLT